MPQQGAEASEIWRVILYSLLAPALAFSVAAVSKSFTHAPPKPTAGDWKIGFSHHWWFRGAVPGRPCAGLGDGVSDGVKASMKELAYGALAGVVAGIVCFSTGYLIVTAVGVPDGSSFGVGFEPSNPPGTLLGAAVWFHLLTITRNRGVPSAIVSMMAYNGVQLVSWVFCLEMLWCLIHRRWRLSLVCLIWYWAFGLIREHGFERYWRIPGLDITQAELGERLNRSSAPVVADMRKWQRWGQVALVLFGAVLAVLAYLQK